ncbi:sucrose-phosphatase 1 [Cryptomeria japonica]|uniref:sucrose-phosphatase 1 n=1 Tax=Cryptomeria japonica TaxID=3369 RepID=UPI0027D9F4BC|nr:sucrose-phosphatase 1 [Cryptomeria japonica]
MWLLNGGGVSFLRRSSRILTFIPTIEFVGKRKGVRNRSSFCSSSGMIKLISTNMAEKVMSKAQPELMLVSDLDFTMVDHDDPSHQSLLNFNSLWAAEYAHNSVLVFSSGRSPQRYNELRGQVPLLTPAIHVLSVGTEIFYGLQPDATWLNLLDQGWNRDIVFEEAKMFPQLQLQEESEQRPHKISFYLNKEEAPKVQEQLLSRLQSRQLDVKLIYSGGIAFDVLPKMGGKGEALAYLMRKMKKDGSLSKNVLVCGDSGNDIELFTVEGVHGVIVSNAQEELIQWYKSHNFINKVYHASERCAGGIIQALQNFNFGPHYTSREKIKNNQFDYPEADLQTERLLGDGAAKREVIEFNLFLEMWLNGHIENNDKSYQRVMGVIAKGATMVYPWGKESNLNEALDLIREKHGLMKGKAFMTWIDNIQEKKLAEGVYLVTWESWEKFNDGEHKGHYATAILVSKEKTPNGVEWLRVHETTMNHSLR